MRPGRGTMTALLFASGGCALVAGVEEITYEEPGPVPADDDGAGAPEGTAPPPAAGGAGSEAEDARAPAPPPTAPPAPAPPADAEAAEAADAIAPAPGPAAECRGADFEDNDRRGPLAARVVLFPGAGLRYAPSCMRIRRGQSVTWLGPLAAYPLAPRGNQASPISTVSAGTAVTFTFPERGRFRFESPGRPSLRGAIDVRP